MSDYSVCYCEKDLESDIGKGVIFKGPMKKLWVLYQLFGDHEDLRDLTLGMSPQNNFFYLCPLSRDLNNHKEQELEINKIITKLNTIQKKSYV